MRRKLFGGVLTGLAAVSLIGAGGALAITAAPTSGATLYVSPGGTSSNTDTSCQDAEYSDISTAINNASSNDTIDVCPGTYQEYVTIPATLMNLTLQGISSSSGNQPVVVFPTTANPNTSTLKADPLITVDGATGATIENLEVSGPYYDSGCESSLATHYGIYVGAGGSATIEKDDVTEIRSLPSEGLNGCQDGVGIGVGQSYSDQKVPPPADHGTATIENNVIENYQKDGILVDGSSLTPSSAQISNNTITGIGPTSVIASNGIEMDDSSTGTVSGNHVSANQYKPSSYQASGILLYSSGAITVSGNTLNANDIGFYAYNPTAALTVQNNSVTNDTTNSDSEGIQLDDVSGGSFTGNTVSGGYVGIDLFDGTSGATVQSNSVTGAGFDGILDQGTTSLTSSTTYSSPPAATGNTFQSDTASGSGTYDCQDATTGTKTAGTANTWTGDTGAKSSPSGICSSAPLYAVNAGGPAISGTPSWTADTSGSPSKYNNAASTSNNNTYPTSATIDTSSAPGVPAAVFQTSRFDLKSTPDLTWSFPVASGTPVTVNLDFAEIYSPCFKVGCRVFNVFVDGTEVLTNFDIYRTAGAGDKGIVESFPVTSPGTVTITFSHVTQEPTINGIEILNG